MVSDATPGSTSIGSGASGVSATATASSSGAPAGAPATSLNLEPNPFEQSFAATKKAQGPGPGPVPGPNTLPMGMSLPMSLPMRAPSSLASVLPGGTANGATRGTTNGRGSISASPSTTSLLYPPQRPVIHSPPMLTPGGSRRLPPLPSPGGTVPPGAVPQGTAGSPGFLAYLPRTGLMPNESSIRSGLTPGALGGGAGYPLLPGLGGSVFQGSGVHLPGGLQGSAVPAGVPPHGGVAAGVPLKKEGSGDAGAPKKARRTGKAAATSAATAATSPAVTVKTESPSGTGTATTTATASHSASTASDEAAEDAALTPAEKESKRKEFLERNRVAASKFRKRKKEYIKRLEEDVRFYEEEYADMAGLLLQLAAVNPVQPPASGQPPLLDLVEQAVRKGDAQGALQILEHTRQAVRHTRLFQRGGTNPLQADEQRQGGTKRQRNAK